MALLIANRYQTIRKLGEGGMGEVFHVFDRLTQQSVALKRVLPQALLYAPDVSSVQMDLAHEFQTLATLHHPHIISVLDYGFSEEKHAYFTMSLLENAQTVIEASKSKTETEKVQYLIGMLQALAYLHRHGILHRDIKPDNALVDAEGEIKVLDFGLAGLRNKRTQRDENVVGTLAYMAPELLAGDLPSELSDLYAVGIIAFEIFAEYHPFKNQHIQAMINQISTGEIDYDDVKAPDAITSVIKRLTMTEPEDRLQDAYSVIEALSQAINQTTPKETIAIRESYLQAAPFVGREQELTQLTNALEQALDDNGKAWLIGGESGVGKSRLVEEIRIRALVKGVLVLRGQGTVDGGASFHLWREIVRRLVIASELTDIDASILKQVVPDIGRLIQKDVTNAPTLEGKAGQQRLIDTIVNLVRSQNQPILLILEDLQWAKESLDVLRKLVEVCSTLPIMIIGNYRSDENPKLPEELTGMEHILLKRLPDEDIAKLSVAMLGETGQEQQILDLLKRETEGNAFFLVEVVRALAEEVGSLVRIGKSQLPEKVFPGGIQEVVHRRLERVPKQAHDLLHTSALAGRQLDFNILKPLASNMNFDQWLAECSNAAVLETIDGQWRFAHEKIREGIINDIEPGKRQQRHEQIANTLQSVYTTELNEYASRISVHYEQAQDYANASTWYATAGHHAKETYAPEVAIQYYRKALGLDPKKETHSQWHVKVLDGLGRMLSWQGEYNESNDTFTQLEKTARQLNNPVGIANALIGLATLQIYQGDFQGATENAQKVEDILQDSSEKQLVAQAMFIRGWNAFRTGDAKTAIRFGEEVLKICQGMEENDLMIQTLNLLGGVQYALGQFSNATQYFTQAYTISLSLGNRPQAMTLLNNIGVIAENHGEYEKAIQNYEEALRIAKDMGVRDPEMLYLSNLGGIYVRTNNIDKAIEFLKQTIKMAESTGFGQLSDTYRYLAEAYLAQANIPEATIAAKRALDLSKDVNSQEYEANAWRILGQIATHQNQAIIVDNDDETKNYSASECFQESEKICEETGMQAELARTLREWARYELQHGDAKVGQEKWDKAKGIFAELDMQFELDQMKTMPSSEKE